MPQRTRPFNPQPRSSGVIPPATQDEVMPAQYDAPLKRCVPCGHEKSPTNFYADPGMRDRRRSWCKICREQASTERLRALHFEALVHYGGLSPCCVCCGESTLELLALDYTGGGGVRQRRVHRAGGGNNFCAWLKWQGYPLRLHVLCHKLQLGNGTGRVCPHAPE
jgi:hypothetical protein